MARIIYGALVDSIRGSIGGTTFQRNAYGFTCKRKPNMVRPWTADQRIMQAAFSRAVKAWKEAESSTRINWETWAGVNPQYAKHNPSSVLTGFACFVKWHVQWFIGGMTTIDTNPMLTIPTVSPVTVKLILATGVFTLDLTTAGGESWNLNYSLSRPLGSAQHFIGTKTRFIKRMTDITGTFDITNLYTAKYGSLPKVGDRIAVDTVPYMEDAGAVLSRSQQIITVTAT